MWTMYFVAWTDDEDGTNWDLFVKAQSAEHALKLWSDYFNHPYKPDPDDIDPCEPMVCTVPTVEHSEPGVIPWPEIHFRLRLPQIVR